MKGSFRNAFDGMSRQIVTLLCSYSPLSNIQMILSVTRSNIGQLCGLNESMYAYRPTLNVKICSSRLLQNILGAFKPPRDAERSLFTPFDFIGIVPLIVRLL